MIYSQTEMGQGEKEKKKFAPGTISAQPRMEHSQKTSKKIVKNSKN